LEEKEPHLIQQVLSRFTSLSLHPSWVLIVFARFFHHQNATVIKYGLEALLTRAEGCYDWGDLVDLTDFLVSQLLGVLNESRIYSVAEDGQHYGEVLRYIAHMQCCGSGMFIPDLPDLDFLPSRIQQEQKRGGGKFLFVIHFLKPLIS
jgi:hypothetical protein